MIHQYKLNGYNIVLDVYSGSVHLVDDVAYDCIALFESTPRDQIIARMMEKYGHLDGVDEAELAACLDDIQALKDDGRYSIRMLSTRIQKCFHQDVPKSCLHAYR